MIPLRFWLAAAVVACGLPNAHATISCSITAIDSFSTNYDALATTDVLGSGTFTVSCTRAAGDPTSVTFTADTVNGGLYYNGGLGNGTYRARQGASSNYVNYGLYTSSAYATAWNKNGARVITGTVNFGSGTSASATATYYVKVPFGQAVPQGTYTDTVTVNMTYGGSTAPSVTFGVTIINMPSCTLATPPGTVSFTYPAFSSTARTASTTFGALCTQGLAYTMALNATAGVVAGLRYTLALSSTNSTGTGASQTFTINGTMDAGQAGTCTTSTCTGSHTHTLTISY